MTEFLGRDRPLFPTNKTTIFTNFGRTAFEQIIRIEGLDNSKIMLPAFICRSSFEPLFEKYKIKTIFVDVEPSSYHIDIRKAREKSGGIDALLLVHTFGLTADIKSWVKFCQNNEIVLIEDCARALGARYQNQVVGSFGKYSIYSLYKVSPITRGGCLVGDFPKEKVNLLLPSYNLTDFLSILPENVRKFLGRSSKKSKNRLKTRRSVELIKGRRMNKINELVFKAYARNLCNKLEENRKNALFFKESLERIGFKFQKDREERVYYTAPAIVSQNRDGLANWLREQGISVETTWSNPWSKSRESGRFEEAYPNTSQISKNIIHLPVQITERERRRLVDMVKEFMENEDKG